MAAVFSTFVPFTRTLTMDLGVVCSIFGNSSLVLRIIFAEERFQKTSFWNNLKDFIVRIMYISVIRAIWLYFSMSP